MTMRRAVSVLAASALTMVGAVGLFAAPAAAASTTVVISQVYGGGGNAGSTYTNDFVELYNRSTAAVSLSGWTIQYASATGATWQSTPLTGSIAPGGYYLVQEANGTAGTTALPTPDAFGTIPMSGTAGKVALRNVATTCTNPCSSAAGTVDFVGFGTANDFEGAVAPAPSNTNAILRGGTPRGNLDDDRNATDFAAGAPTPTNSGTGGGGGPTLTAIHDIQGAGSVSPKNGQTVVIEGIVTGWDDEIGYDNSPCTAFPRDAGIFVQSEDALADADPLTSEGIFVGNVSPRANYPLGTKVRLTGVVKDGGGGAPPFDQTRMEVTTQPTVLSSGAALPAAIVIDPAQGSSQAASRPYYESLEGMRVALATGVANAGGTNKFGELFLEPGAVAIDTLQRTDAAARQISRIGTSDDAGAGNPANPLIEHPSSTRVLADKGDTVANVVGPFDYSFGLYKIVVQAGTLPTVAKTGSAYPFNLTLPPAGGNNTRIASFNVENLFPTGGSLDCTTLTASDYATKRGEVVNAIGTLLKAPDIVAVQEIGDLRGTNPSSLAVLQDVATDLGTSGAGSYTAYAQEGNDNRGIDVGFLVKSNVTVNSVTQYGKTFANPTSFVCGDVTGLLFDRPPLVLDATLPGTLGNVLIVNNHFASKAANDACRVAQAAFVQNLVKGFETAQLGRKVIVTGDLNAFEDDGALTTLGDPSQTTLSNLWSNAAEPDRYSYQFSGLLQTLDHMLISSSLTGQVADFRYAHLDNDYYKRTSSSPDGHKVSDHDPPVLTLTETLVPVVPEAPMSVLLPLSGLVLLAGVGMVGRRRLTSRAALA
jgi:uncharacterized protein